MAVCTSRFGASRLGVVHVPHVACLVVSVGLRLVGCQSPCTACFGQCVLSITHTYSALLPQLMWATTRGCIHHYLGSEQSCVGCMSQGTCAGVYCSCFKLPGKFSGPLGACLDHTGVEWLSSSVVSVIQTGALVCSMNHI